ncbi:MAG TPA: glycosyltransferase family 4 protein [Candidatus Angelobacter sp.]|jgi:glycosyltransferase involved in cell wall biosynthesis|nr:glycosyltransferase family 4 protein [Candidatus Angelobacter sp.]
MNIALLMHELLVEGGGERQCLSLARALQQQGHQVTVYTSAFDASNCFPEICRELKIIEVGRGHFHRLRKPAFVRGYLDMAHIARTLATGHEIWNPHHWPAQWGAVRLKHKLGGKVVWMCNDVPNFHQQAHQRETLGLFRSALAWLYYVYDRAQNRKTDLTLFLSNWAEGEFRAIYPGETRVIRSGADPGRFAPGGDRLKIRQRFGFDSNDFVLLWLGIFMPHRRLQDAIEAMGLLRSSREKIKLLLAGSDRSFPDYCASLKALVQKLGLQEQVTFAGKVEDTEIRDFYCACDAFLFPNENQTWGLAVLEAMACGCPVLVSSGAAVHEVLTDNEGAILFPARSPKVLAEKIDQLATQPELRQRIAEAGMRLVRETYNWERFATQVANVCQEVSSCKSRDS